MSTGAAKPQIAPETSVPTGGKLWMPRNFASLAGWVPVLGQQVPFYRFIKSWQAKLQHIFRSDAPEFGFMAEWIAIAQWKDCVQMARPGIIFEVRNAEGQSLFTPCVNPLPPMPFDWKSPPLMFRAIPEPAAQRSTPIPPPKGGR